MVVELSFRTTADAAEALSELLWTAGAAGVEERDATTLRNSALGAGQTELLVWLLPEQVDAYVSEVTAAAQASELTISAIERRVADESEWQDRWKEFFRIDHIGRFVIVPSWESYQPKPDELVLELDPGRAFGTGRHASTRLCLQALDRLDREIKNFCDLGCGSAILAVAAAKKWSSAQGLGIDVDADAIAWAQENIERNGLARRVKLEAGRLSDSGAAAAGTFDLLIANIEPDVLIPLAPEVAAAATSDARLVLSGIVTERGDEVVRAYEQAGWQQQSRIELDGWVAPVLRRGHK